MRKGWEKKKLEEVCSFINRGIAPCYAESSGIRVLNQKCIRDHCINLDFSRWHDAQNKKVPRERFVQRGDVLVNSTGTGTLGRVAQVRTEYSDPITVDAHITIVRPYFDKFFPDFFGYAMMTIEDLITKSGEGCGGQTELSRKVLAEQFTISYPECITEQRRIVDILDDAFARIDKAIENTEKSIANAKELFETCFDNIFIGDLKWTNNKLGNIAEFKNGLNFTKSSQGEIVDIVGVKDFQNNMYVPTSELDSVQIDGALDGSYLLKNNDILTVRSNGNKQLIGRCMLVSHLKNKTSYSGFTIRVRLTRQDEIEPEYLVRYLKTPRVRSMLIDSGNGANINNLNQGILSILPVRYPDKIKQLSIIKITNNYEELFSILKANYTQKLTSLQSLKQSLLAAAFSGELTADFNPDALEL